MIKKTISPDDAEIAAMPALQKAAPISTDALGILRIVGSVVAILGVIAGIVILVNAPEGPSDIDIRYRGDELPVQIPTDDTISIFIIRLGADYWQYCYWRAA